MPLTRTVKHAMQYKQQLVKSCQSLLYYKLKHIIYALFVFLMSLPDDLLLALTAGRN